MEYNLEFAIDGRDVYCKGHPELEKRVGFTIGEGIAMFGISWGPLYIVNLKTGEMKQLIDDQRKVVGFTDDDFDWEKLETIEHRGCLDNRVVAYSGLHRYCNYRNGVCCISWMLYPDGRYFVCSNQDAGCDFFETKYGDLTPPGLLITDDMTSQDVERLRQSRRKGSIYKLPNAPRTHFNYNSQSPDNKHTNITGFK